MPLPPHLVDPVIHRALREDLPYLDLSGAWLFPPEHHSAAYLLANAPGVFCGGAIFCRVFELLDDTCQFDVKFADGDTFNTNDTLLTLEGPTAALLQGERSALNLLQHLCGIATATAELVQAVAHTSATITETRKTLPGLRALQKYAVTCGGGRNHRFSLSDAVMLKDNHIDACGSIQAAVQRVREHIGHMTKIEVETRSLAEVEQAYHAGADVIMLDNMSLSDMRAAVAWVRANERPVLLEASGDITAARAAAVAQTGVDILSLGSLTHSVTAQNISTRLR